MARHRRPSHSKQRRTLRKSPPISPRSTPSRHRPKVTKKPPSKFRLRLNKVQVITGSELFERRVAGIKEEKKRAFRRMGKLGPRVLKRDVPKTPRVKYGRLPPGTKTKKRIVKIKVLIKARIKGKLGYFTKSLSIRQGRTGKQAKKIAGEFVERIEEMLENLDYKVDLMAADVQFEKAA